MTSSSVAASIACRSSIGFARNASVSAAQDAKDFFALLLFERHDLVVDLDGAERLQVEAGAAAGAAMDDAGNRRAVLGFDDQHVAAVAVADDLVLQIRRGFFSPQIRFERRAQPRPLLAQLRRAAAPAPGWLVVDLSGRIDLPPHFGDLRLERRRSSRQSPSTSGTAR